MKLTVPIKVRGVLYKVGDDVPEKVFKLYPSLKKFKDGTNTSSKSSIETESSGSKSKSSKSSGGATGSSTN